MKENLHIRQLNALDNLEDIINKSLSIEEIVFNSNQILSSNFNYIITTGIFENKEYLMSNIDKKEIEMDKFLDGIPTIINKNEYIMPLRGKEELREKINIPKEKNCILGAIKILSQKEFKNEEIKFLNIYSKRVGIAIHNAQAREFYKKNEDNWREKIEEEKKNLIDFAQTFDHEVRGQISIALGFANLNNQILESSKNHLSLESKIPTIIDYSKEIIKSLSNVESKIPFLRMLNLNSESVKINAYIHNYQNLIEPVIRKTFQDNNKLENNLVLSIDKTLLSDYIYVDPLYINLIFENLIRNACNHGIENGTIITSIYRQNGQIVFDFLNSTNERFSDEKISTIKNKGISFSKSTNRNSGLGLFIIDRVISEGYLGKLNLENKESINISRALDSKAKIVLPIKGSLENISPELGTYYRAEVRIPYESFDFRTLIR